MFNPLDEPAQAPIDQNKRDLLLRLSALLSLSCASALTNAQATDSTRTEEPAAMTMPQSFAAYLRHFDYAERQAMKIGVAEALDLYATGKAQLVDIRFAEEYAAWHLGFGLHIPLDALPDRLHELDRSKLIITLCPHYDRAEIARLFLTLEGFQSRYLNEGMLGLVDALRGDKARDLMRRLSAQS
jgi:rhodanese-related sulfurtransferase